MPNRDQRRRDGTFEYAQLDLAPASDEPARCEHGSTEAHQAVRCSKCGGKEWALTRHPDCFGAECVTCRNGAMDIGWAVDCYVNCPGPAASGTPDAECRHCGGSGNAHTFDGAELGICGTCHGTGSAAGGGL